VSSIRQSAAGATRTCPHCRATILQSAAVCPACKKHLRFEPGAAARAIPTSTPLKIEGSIRHPDGDEAWEYSMMVSVKNERGEELTRQVVGVGALQPGEVRTFSFAVEVFANQYGAVEQDASDARASTPAPTVLANVAAPPSAAAKRQALKGVNRS
jgi:hypothetical protein